MSSSYYTSRPMSRASSVVDIPPVNLGFLPNKSTVFPLNIGGRHAGSLTSDTTSQVDSLVQFEQRLRLGEILPTQEYVHYVTKACQDLFDYLTVDVLSSLQEMLSMQHCPLRTPLQCEPHHVLQVPLFRDQMITHLEKFHKDLESFKEWIERSTRALPDIIASPNMHELNCLKEQYRPVPTVHTWLEQCWYAFQEIDKQTRTQWKQRDFMQKQARQSFEETIRFTCTLVVEKYQSLCPVLITFLNERKANEDILHKTQEQHEYKRSEQRALFYQGVYALAQSRLTIVKDVLVIYESTLEQHKPHDQQEQEITLSKAEWEVEVKRFQALQSTLNIWEKLLLYQTETKLPYPVLPSLVGGLNTYIVNLQERFAKLLVRLMPATPTPVINLPSISRINRTYDGSNEERELQRPVESYQEFTRSRRGSVANSTTSDREDVDEDYPRRVVIGRGTVEIEDEYEFPEDPRDVADYAYREAASTRSMTSQGVDVRNEVLRQYHESRNNSVYGSSESVKFLGLVDVSPELQDYFKQMEITSVDQLRSQKEYHDDVLNRYNRFQSRITEISNELIHTMSSPQVAQFYEEVNKSTADVTTTMQQHIRLKQYWKQQHDLRQSQLFLTRRRQELDTLLEDIKPKIESQMNLVQALRRVTHMLQTPTRQFTDEWSKLIDQEHNICENWRSETTKYNCLYIETRFQTRWLMESQLENTRQELAMCFSRTLADLMQVYYQKLQEIQEMENSQLTAIRNARECVQSNLKHLLQVSTLDMSHVSKELERILHQYDARSIDQDRRDSHNHTLEMQQLLIKFSTTMNLMIESLSENEYLMSLLKVNDNICVHEHSKGTLPCPRSYNGVVNSLSSTPSTWILTTMYPERIQASGMLAPAAGRRQEATSFVLEHKGFRPEPIDVARTQRTMAEFLEDYTKNAMQARTGNV